MMGYNVLSKISRKDWLYPIFSECTELGGGHVGGGRYMDASHPHVTKNVDYARTRWVYDNMHRGKWTCNVDKRASILIYGIKCCRMKGALGF